MPSDGNIPTTILILSNFQPFRFAGYTKYLSAKYQLKIAILYKSNYYFFKGDCMLELSIGKFINKFYRIIIFYMEQSVYYFIFYILILAYTGKTN